MRSVPQQLADQQAQIAAASVEAARQLPAFRDNRPVRAARIEDVSTLVGNEAVHLFVPGSEELVRVPVTAIWLQRYKPEPGDYYVTFGDGFPWKVPARQFQHQYVPEGMRLIDFVRGYARTQLDGYREEMADGELVGCLPEGLFEVLAIRFIASKVEPL